MKVISTVRNLSKRYTSKNIAHYCSTKPSYSLFIYESETLRGLQFQLYRIETTGLLHYAQSRILHNWRYISNRARQTSCYLAYRPLIRSYIYVLSKYATSDDIEWPSRSRTYTASFKMFFVQFWSRWHFNTVTGQSYTIIIWQHHTYYYLVFHHPLTLSFQA